MPYKKSGIKRYVIVKPDKNTEIRLAKRTLKLAGKSVYIVNHLSVDLTFPPPPPPPPPPVCELRPIWIQLEDVSLHEWVPLGVQSWDVRIRCTVFPPGVAQTTHIPRLVFVRDKYTQDHQVYFHNEGTFCGPLCSGSQALIEIWVTDNDTGTINDFGSLFIEFIPGMVPLPISLPVDIESGSAEMWFVFSAMSMC